MAINESVIVGIILSQAKQVLELTNFVQDFIMKVVITKDFEDLEYVKVFDTLNMYLDVKEGADGQPSTKKQAVFNAEAQQGAPKPKRGPRPPRPGKDKRVRFNNFNKRTNQNNPNKPGKEGCSYCGDSRYAEPNSWKKHLN